MVDGGEAKAIPFLPRLFDYGHNAVGDLPAAMGFAGFKILYPLNKPGDELGAYQGASYFRMLCRGAVYGLSARGLAIDSGGPAREEFPDFEEFWIERPTRDAREIAIDALLDGPRGAGAYLFVVAPGDDTAVRVHAVLYRRRNPAVLGFAPLTTMFWHGKNTNTETDDIRPEVHDSDGLMLHTGRDEWIWRPLTNPAETRLADFADDNPRGFGLMQRDRRFEAYEDLEAVLPAAPERVGRARRVVGAGKRAAGRVARAGRDQRQHRRLLDAGEAARARTARRTLLQATVVHGPDPSSGRQVAMATRHGRSRTHEPDLERFVDRFRRRRPSAAAGRPIPADRGGGQRRAKGAVLVHGDREKSLQRHLARGHCAAPRRRRPAGRAALLPEEGAAGAHRDLELPLAAGQSGGIAPMIELPTSFRPKTGAPEAWNSAYVRVEDYLRAHRIHNRLHQIRLIQRILERTAERHAADPRLDPTVLAAEETEALMDAWFADVLDVRGQPHDRIAVDGRVALLLCDGPQRWPDAFLDERQIPADFVQAMRASSMRAGPDLAVSSMVPRPIDLGPITEAAGADARAHRPLADPAGPAPALAPVRRGVLAAGIFYLTR